MLRQLHTSFGIRVWLGLSNWCRFLPAAVDGIVGISIFEVSVLEFGDAFGAVVDCVSELPLESGPL